MRGHQKSWHVLKLFDTALYITTTLSIHWHVWKGTNNIKHIPKALYFQYMLFIYLQKRMARPFTQRMRRSCVWWPSRSRCHRGPTIQTPSLKWASSMCWEMTAGKCHVFSIGLAKIFWCGRSWLKKKNSIMIFYLPINPFKLSVKRPIVGGQCEMRLFQEVLVNIKEYETPVWVIADSFRSYLVFQWNIFAVLLRNHVLWW